MSRADTKGALRRAKVTVVMPVYNGARYLEAAIGSVLQQTWRDWELVIVNDGSSDNSPLIADRFAVADGRIRVIHQENRGLARALNRGIRDATGEYLGGLAQDDLWLPDYLSSMVALLDAEPATAAAYCAAQLIDENGRKYSQWFRKVVPPQHLYDELLAGNFIGACTVLVRRSYLEEIGLYDETLPTCEDWDLWIRLAERYQVVGVPKTLVHYRVHGAQMSANPELMAEATFAVIRKHVGPEEGGPASWAASRRRGYGGRYLHLAVEHLRRGDREKACRQLARALECWPDQARRLETFYELAWAEQQPGFKGDPAQLDAERTAARTMEVLESVFSDPSLPPSVRACRRDAYANAHLTLALINYGQRRMGAARRHLWKTLAIDARRLLDPRVITVYVKSLAGARLLRRKRR